MIKYKVKNITNSPIEVLNKIIYVNSIIEMELTPSQVEELNKDMRVSIVEEKNKLQNKMITPKNTKQIGED